MTAQPDISLVLVSYFSSAAASICIESMRSEAQQCGVTIEVVVVDHAGDEGERQALAGLGADHVLHLDNHGYAAGLNAGAAAASGRVLLLANPDIELHPGSLSRLLEALGQGFGVAGPQLVWDTAGEVHLPIPEDPAPAAELWRVLRRRSHLLWRLGLSRAIKQSWGGWSAVGPMPAPSLRGPLLVTPAELWHRLGPMDEGYFLYYEETDWLWRARRAGVRIGLVGGAKVIHRWGHSTRLRPDREVIEKRSMHRFLERNYTPGWRFVLSRASGSSSWSHGARMNGPHQLDGIKADIWLLSPFPHLIPAAGWLPSTAGADVPVALESLCAEGRWHVVAARRHRGGWQPVASRYWGDDAQR